MQIKYGVPELRRKKHANRTHYEVGAKVRKTIQELGETMPENLPSAESIKKLESRKRTQPKALEQPPSETDVTGHPSERGGIWTRGLTPTFLK